MDKFWEWMREKERAGFYGKNWNLLHKNLRIEEVPKQMLIGYMIDFSYEKRIQCNININYCTPNKLYEFLERGIDCYSAGKRETEEMKHECEYDSDGGTCRICKNSVIDTILPKESLDLLMNGLIEDAKTEGPRGKEVVKEVRCPVCKSKEIKKSYLSQGHGSREYNVCRCGIMFESV